jgi:hypothetical protein
MQEKPPETPRFLSFGRGCELRDIDNWAGLVLQAWEEVSRLPSPEAAVEGLRRAGLDPSEFVRLVRAAETWRANRGRRYRPERSGGPAEVAARYDFRVEQAGRRFRAAIVDRRSSEILWEGRFYTRARALGEMTREAHRLPLRAEPETDVSARSAEIESAGAWLEAAEEEYREATRLGNSRRIAFAREDVGSARDNYVRVITGQPR